MLEKELVIEFTRMACPRPIYPLGSISKTRRRSSRQPWRKRLKATVSGPIIVKPSRRASPSLYRETPWAVLMLQPGIPSYTHSCKLDRGVTARATHVVVTPTEKSHQEKLSVTEAHCIGDGVVRIDLYLVKMPWLRWAICKETQLKKIPSAEGEQDEINKGKRDSPADNTRHPKDECVIVGCQDCINESISGERCKLCFSFAGSLRTVCVIPT